MKSDQSSNAARGLVARTFRLVTLPARVFVRTFGFFIGAAEIRDQISSRIERYRDVKAVVPNGGENEASAQERLDSLSIPEREAIIAYRVKLQRLCCAALWTAIITTGYGVAEHQMLSSLAAATWAVCMTVIGGKHAWIVDVVREGRIRPFSRWFARHLDIPFWPLSMEE